ncbi:hypothetical protein RFI_23547, partial [Reticulomyxa filosa]
YYAIEPLELRDAADLLSQLTHYSVGDIRSHWTEFRDVTMFKPLHIKKLARLNAKLRYEELSFGELLSLYHEFDPNFLTSHSNFPPSRAASKKHSTADEAEARYTEEEQDLLADEDEWETDLATVGRDRATAVDVDSEEDHDRHRDNDNDNDHDRDNDGDDDNDEDNDDEVTEDDVDDDNEEEKAEQTKTRNPAQKKCFR